MTSRERIKAILALEIPDRMGLFEHFWGETLRDYWPNEGYPKDADPGAHFGYDMALAWGVGFDLAPIRGQDITIEETDEWRVSKNGFGATLKHWKKKSGTPEHIAFDCTTREVWERDFKPKLTPFDPARIDIQAARKSYGQLTAGDQFAAFGHLMHFEILRVLLGDYVMLQSLLLDPDWINDICRSFTRLFMDAYDRIFREVGLPDGMFMYDDLGYRNGPYMSLKTYREVIGPHHKALVGFFRDHGLPVILHSCGDVRKLVPGVIEAGINCLQPMEAKAGCNVLELSELYGNRIAFMGNIDVTKLNTNRRDVIRAEIEGKLHELRRRRVPYIFHSDHSIPPDVRYESYKFALEVYRENAGY